MRLLIKGGTIVNEGRMFDGSIVVDGKDILAITEGGIQPEVTVDETIDASGCFILPGIIDDHVHFREPGLTEKADIDSESRAAAAGGVTSYLDMPNTVPQTTTLEALDEKFRIAAAKSHVNYSFFFGATNDNTEDFSVLDRSRVPGIKLFMGSSTGNMLVDRREALERIFSTADMPIMAHCEDTTIINRNMAQAKERYGEDPDVRHHPEIRSAEACYESTRLAVELARKRHAREATVSHLYFCDRDYAQLGTRIKCNPAIKTEGDREALQQALNDGRIAVIGTDHAPHLLAQKEGGCARAASGMPMIQFSLVTMLELVDRGVLTLERLVELMCHNPARLFGIRQRGFLRPGYRADMVLVRPNTGWTVSRSDILSKCGWSPMEGHTYLWQVQRTICNGHTVYHGGTLDDAYIGEPLCFDHDA